MPFRATPPVHFFGDKFGNSKLFLLFLATACVADVLPLRATPLAASPEVNQGHPPVLFAIWSFDSIRAVLRATDMNLQRTIAFTF